MHIAWLAFSHLVIAFSKEQGYAQGVAKVYSQSGHVGTELAVVHQGTGLAEYMR